MGDQRVAQRTSDTKNITVQRQPDRQSDRAIASPRATAAMPVATHPMLKLQRQIGNRAVAGQIQAKMTVGKPNDTYEQEADRVANTVMRMPDTLVQQPVVQQPVVQKQPEEKKDEKAQAFPIQRQTEEKKDEQAQAKLAIGAITPLAQRAPDEKDEKAQMLQRAPDEKDEKAQMLQMAPDEKDEKAQMLQMAPEDEQAQAKGTTDVSPQVAPNVEGRIQSMRGSGQSLPDHTRGFFESRMGYDLSGVRIHADAQAGEVAGHLNAQAFAIGQDVFFNTGRYEPQTHQGKWLLAHELTHTVQQTPSVQQTPTAQRKASTTLSLSPHGVIRRKVGAGGPKAPSSPAQDPAFQAMVKKAKAAAKQQKQHDPAKSKAAESQAAAVPPANDIGSKAAGKQVGQMDQQQPKAFDRKAFKAALLSKIAATAPKNLKEADEFKESGKVGTIKGELTGQVDSSKQQSGGAIESKVKGTPDPSGIPAKAVASLPANTAGAPPSSIGAELAIPKPKTASEVSLQAGSQSLDQQMAAADVTEDQLKKSNEPEFQAAADTKQQAQKDAVTAPQEYRQSEQGVLTQAQSQAVTTAKTQLIGMHGVRGQAQSKTTTAQQQAKAQDEQKRVEVANELQTLYTQTKKAAEDRLARLDTEVNQAFDQGATQAQQAFESYVQRKMDAYKDDRYGGLGGGALWLKDKFLGLPSEVNAFYQDGRKLYIAQMDAVLDRVAVLVEKGLNEAKAEIAKGKKAIEKKLNDQPEGLRKALQADAQKIQGQFDQLEQSVDAKQDQLLDSLTQKYNEKLQAIDARIDEMKAANRGLVDQALEAVGGVIKAILELKNMLLGVLAKAAGAIKKIIRDPIGFLGNLVSGVKQGFMNFVGNIGAHLQKGLMGWLFGAIAEAGIQLPDSFDLKGIMTLVLQVLGATWAFIRARAVKILGEKVVKALETTAEIFMILATKGIMGVWEYIQEQLSSLKDVVIEGIKSFVTESIIKAGVTWIIGLLNPAGAFIKACKAIYDVVMFFVERGSQIIALVNAVVDSVSAIADGAIGVAASAVENALSKALPVAISFLAALLGVTGISKKIQEIIKKVQAPVGKAIDWLINKAVSLVKKVGKFLGFGKGKEKKKAEQSESNMVVKEPFAMGSEGHTITAGIKGNSIVITMASSQDLILGASLSKAITEVQNDQTREDSQKRAILGYLSAAKIQVENIRKEYNQDIEFDKFAKPRIAKIISNLSQLAKYKPPITSLEHVISQGKPRYIPSGYNIRKQLYDRTTGGAWTTLSESLRQKHLVPIRSELFAIWQQRDDKRDPTNYVTAKARWDAAQNAKRIPVKDAPTFNSYDHPKHFHTFKYQTDHKTSLGNFWNNGEKNLDDNVRRTTVLNTSNLEVLTAEENNSKSGIKFDREVGKGFTSAVANCPPGSTTIDGTPFKDTQ